MAISGKKKVEVVGITLIVFVFFHTIVQIFVLVNVSYGLEPSAWRAMISRAIGRLIITWGLSAFLLGGAGWARLLLGLGSCAGIVFSVIGWIALTSTGGSIFSPLGLTAFSLVPVYVWVVYMLYVDGDVIRHFDPRGGY